MAITVACFCGFVYTVVHGPVICPRCGKGVNPPAYVDAGVLPEEEPE